MTQKQKMLSVVVPCYNEEENIKNFYTELTKTLNKLDYDYEIIFVDDGSHDSTWNEIKNISGSDSVKAVSLSRNFGHPAALEAGLNAAKGDAIVMMDADLQHPPTVIPSLIKKWEEGFEIVKTIRLQTEGASFFKKITSSLFYALLNTFSDLRLRDGEADFRLVDRSVLEIINKMPESPKFYRGLFNWVGFNTAEVEYKAANRTRGKSSFTLKKMVELARLGLTSFSMLPLKIIITIGLGLSSVSFLALLVMVYVKLFVSFVFFSNNIILLTFLIFVTGLLSTFQGIIAIYMVDVFDAAKGRPSYIVSKKVNLDD